MRVRIGSAAIAPIRRVRRRLASESGFTMIVVLAALVITAMLSAAAFAAVTGDTFLTQQDLNGKQAYDAAQAGLQAYLYQLNDNASTSEWWETCSNDTASNVTVPGESNATYSYQPVGANGFATCVSTNPVGSMIDTATGTLRLAFTGNAGGASRTIVASFKTLSPLSFLWYTVYETEDPSVAPQGSNCAVFYYSGSGPSSSCDIYWVSGDKMNGPMYTQDQFLVYPGDSPQFGRAGSEDEIASQDPSNANAKEICASDNCQSASVSNADPDVTPQVPMPSDNSNLLTDATNHGLVETGTTTLTISGNTATGAVCTSATSCTAINISNLANDPIIYDSNGTGCNSTYTPTSITYPQITSGTYKGDYYGACGDVYVSGSYSSPLTIAAADDIVITGNLTNSTDTGPSYQTEPTGSATLGLVANEYVRVMHGCTGSYATATPAVTIDAAILTLQHSFFVDNYGCGATNEPQLTVHGAIAQYYRGIVGTVGSGPGGSGGTGYLKNYNYDDRLALILPPYLFDLQNTEWTVYRESLCSTTASTSASNSCGL